MEIGLSFVMDALVILLLAGTIFFAARLSMHIKVFRDSRKDLEKLIGDLSSHVERAENAIAGLRENARESGRDLQEQINEAKALSEELQFMSQSGDSLAGRLEKLAEKNARSSEYYEPVDFSEPLRAKKPAAPKPQKPVGNIAPKPAAPAPKKAEPFSGFAIRDPEFDDDEDDLMDENGLMGSDYADDGDDDFTSRAEKELMEALQGRTKTKTGAGGV